MKMPGEICVPEKLLNCGLWPADPKKRGEHARGWNKIASAIRRLALSGI
jgi:hypothetical protein